MTDTELSALESAAKAATPGPWEYNSRRKEIWAIDPHHTPIVEVGAYGQWNVDYIVAANPAVVLKLIAELRQTRAERDWLADRLGNLNEESSYSELCPDKFATETVCKQRIKCNTCWLQAAKEATCIGKCATPK